MWHKSSKSCLFARRATYYRSNSFSAFLSPKSFALRIAPEMTPGRLLCVFRQQAVVEYRPVLRRVYHSLDISQIALHQLIQARSGKILSWSCAFIAGADNLPLSR
ncbi:hypothetical protein KCP74_14210 [Salmonella enterica subsp. enterica]|nr:hypothetical protein KCP74_14210 [Salmonella enterica subsp. enterica]